MAAPTRSDGYEFAGYTEHYFPTLRIGESPMCDAYGCENEAVDEAPLDLSWGPGAMICAGCATDVDEMLKELS